MKIEKLKELKHADNNPRLTKAYNKVHCLIEALSTKEIPSEVLNSINEAIKLLNSFSGTEKELTKAFNKKYTSILALVKKELKFVTKNHYKTLWMVMGMSFGVVFSVILGDSGNIAIGIGLGTLLGIIVGTNLDKNAKESGNQLQIEDKTC